MPVPPLRKQNHQGTHQGISIWKLLCNAGGIYDISLKYAVPGARHLTLPLCACYYVKLWAPETPIQDHNEKTHAAESCKESIRLGAKYNSFIEDTKTSMSRSKTGFRKHDNHDHNLTYDQHFFITAYQLATQHNRLLLPITTCWRMSVLA